MLNTSIIHRKRRLDLPFSKESCQVFFFIISYFVCVFTAGDFLGYICFLRLFVHFLSVIFFSDVSFSFENISTVGEFTLEVTGNNSRRVIVAIYICYGDNFQLIETQILR